MGTTTFHTPLAGPKYRQSDADENSGEIVNSNPIIINKFYTKAYLYFHCEVGFRSNYDQASHPDLIVVHKSPN